MRRAGKTWLLFARVRALIEAGTPRADLLYLDFEDERLGDVSAADLGALVDAHYRANPGARGREGAFFFDEIQLVEGWARFVRRLLDAGSCAPA
ncbi:MAG: AAA family ATPase [Sandaracinaceae bacterium]|nr:AAA family ATPase [Sandaracinaceae bacterium]